MEKKKPAAKKVTAAKKTTQAIAKPKAPVKLKAVVVKSPEPAKKVVAKKTVAKKAPAKAPAKKTSKDDKVANSLSAAIDRATSAMLKTDKAVETPISPLQAATQAMSQVKVTKPVATEKVASTSLNDLLNASKDATSSSNSMASIFKFRK